MSQTIPIAKREPDVIAAGDNVEWTRQFEDYDSSVWTLNYVLRNGKNIYKFSAVASSGVFQVTLTTAVTALWVPGVYAIGAYVTTGSGATLQQVQVKTFFPTITVTPNLASNPQGTDTSTFAEKSLASIEATILKLTSRSVESAQVNGQAYTLANIGELFKMRERFRSEVTREQQQARLNAGLGGGNKIGIRFKSLATGWPQNQTVPWQ